jgi:hypothetical protein
LYGLDFGAAGLDSCNGMYEGLRAKRVQLSDLAIETSKASVPQMAANLGHHESDEHSLREFDSHSQDGPHDHFFFQLLGLWVGQS